MKVYRLWILFLFLFFSSCLLIQKLFMPKEPEFKIRDVSLYDASLQKFVIKVDTDFINHYRFGLPETKLNFDVKINQQFLSKIESGKFKVAAKSSVNLPLFVEIRYQDLYKTIQTFLNQPKLTLSLDGGTMLHLNVPGLPKQIYVPFTIEKTIPSFVPKVELEDIELQIERVRMDGFPIGIPKMKLIAKLNIQNQGGSKFFLQANNIAFTLADQEIIKFQPIQTTFDTKQMIDLTMELPDPETITKFLKNPKSSYLLKGNLEFQFADVDISKFNIPIEFRGKVTQNL
ncbi:MAG: LEA type 2 family protein [Leptospiraceae bacterium]|nr:LEA type 2 family protein [Leptospiraceae bacterium]MDW7976990.1 hypothetical protein [Leptospiraceae bacterium]